MRSAQGSAKLPNTRARSPVATVDLVVRKKELLLLERRGRPPFENQHSLPGGHVEIGETVESAALRELKEETRVDAELIAILGVYSDPNRDPRRPTISTVFIADWLSGEPMGRDDARTAEWYMASDVRKLTTELAFDHSKILSDYFKWIKAPKETFWSTKVL